MASTPPTPPAERPQRPVSALIRPPRSHSRLSMTSTTKQGGSRVSDDDGKISVKVAVRIRPPLKSTDPGFESIPQRFQRSMVQVTSPTSLTVDSPHGRKSFAFDQVFGPEIGQEGVWDYVAESVAAFVQGYNVSVLAYGQSGAGKSYTMGTSGPDEQNDARVMGVIPRAAAALLDRLNGPSALSRNGSGIRTPTRYSTNSIQTIQSLAKTTGRDRPWQLSATYVEVSPHTSAPLDGKSANVLGQIYQHEHLRDLLVPETVPLHERSAVTIREDDKGRILLTGLHPVTINSIDDLLQALNVGSTIRQTDATAINAKSSRSHAVFSLNLVQRKHRSAGSPVHEKRLSMPLEATAGGDNWVTIDSKLHFVDLAGSERMKQTGASGERAKEGIAINVGLATLGKVIAQLSSRQAGSHVSYRDSKLTRLLQDSLGGDAITYMIACVTPAEFHLHETLNTIQYAQRAREIQTKPQIHQVSDEADKQAAIDRLKAEVAFLREQIGMADRSDRPSQAAHERSDRPHEREVELQNHLLDVQENYSALSQRHAKLISEVRRAQEGDSGVKSMVNGSHGESASERLKRSSSFAQAAEHAVLEYEKTIESLETSLSRTRSSLATTEGTLLEREAKCAYADAANQQLQARLRGLLDRESSTNHYLHDLEARLDGRDLGEERNSALVTDLRKEVVRLRETEATCEDYISTLEERLAEADQDTELMQREIHRLEHVVERQRSIGRLDDLLYELDDMESDGKPDTEHRTGGITNGVVDGVTRAMPGPGAKKGDSAAILREAIETAIPESDEEDWEHPPAMSPPAMSPPAREADRAESDAPSPTQSQFAAEKLATVNQKLLDLGLAHEGTMHEYDLLAAKYDEALRTLATLQDAVDESRHTVVLSSGSPTFLEGARVKALKTAGPASSSRSLSSELSSLGEPTGTPDRFDSRDASPDPTSRFAALGLNDGIAAVAEVAHLKRLQREKEQGMAVLQEKYAQLEEEHLNTLDLVEELKADVRKVKLNSPATPSSPMIRRKSSQNVMTIDRAHRSLASLGNIAAENFENDPDTMQNFELNLAAVMHELHHRSERVQVLEGELASVKKEMEMKATMIAGLTRERYSLQGSSTMDTSIVSSMRDQLLHHENQMQTLQDHHAARERELATEIAALKKSLPSHGHRSPSNMLGIFPETPPVESISKDPDAAMPARNEFKEQKIAQLQGELAQRERRHQSAVAELEATLNHLTATAAQLGSERDQHHVKVAGLEQLIGEHQANIDGHQTRIGELEHSQADAQREIDAGYQFRETMQQHLEGHRKQISLLEDQISDHRSVVESHNRSMQSLQESHSRNLAEARLTASLDATAKTEARMAELTSQRAAEIAAHQTTTRDLEHQLQAHQSSVEDHQRQMDAHGALVATLQKEREIRSAQTHSAGDGLEDAKVQLKAAEEAKAAAEASSVSLETKVEELTRGRDELNHELADLREKEQRASRLVEELEGQLSSTYEDSREKSGRFSLMQSTRDQELQEARSAALKAQDEITVLNGRLQQLEVRYRADHECRDASNGLDHLQRANSSASGGSSQNERSTSATVRKSTSLATLPSPPPVIPLPPIPTSAPAPALTSSNADPIHASTTATTMVSAQLADDQEARIRTIEKHLFAEKQLTATLEEALVDLETQGNRVKAEVEGWKKKAWGYEDEIAGLRKEQSSSRWSVQAVEEERSARREAEAAKAHLEESMAAIGRKKKRSQFNCF